MIDKHVNSPKSIKYYVKNYLYRIKDRLKGKVVIDMPAGKGSTSEILVELGAKVEPFDLFPEYFLLEGVECKRADISDPLPVEEKHADMLICQEGIEHFSDQVKVFKEFNRVLKKGGELVITTPSYSSLEARFSYFLFESETSSKMPPNEIDDVWMSDKSISSEIYHGHIFLVGLQKLRILGKLAGFDIQSIEYVRLSKGSLILFPFFYPLILLRSYLAYYRNMKKDKGLSKEQKKAIYKDQFDINTSIANLLNKHTFIIFRKEKDSEEVDFRNEKMIKKF